MKKTYRVAFVQTTEFHGVITMEEEAFKGLTYRDIGEMVSDGQVEMGMQHTELVEYEEMVKSGNIVQVRK